MNDFTLLIKTLQQFGNILWINQYFDLLKRLLVELDLADTDPRLALTLSKNQTLPVNIGQRYVLKPLIGESIRCIVPADFEENAVSARFLGYFSPNTTRDAKWVQFYFPTGIHIPEVLYTAFLTASETILSKTKKSGYRKYHNSLLYHFTMEPTVRSEVLAELKQLRG